jgi:hypothetical protein
MEVFLPIAQVFVNPIEILLLSAIVGILSGLFGVGGGFLMTPFLIFLGVPPAYAVANEANNILGYIRLRIYNSLLKEYFRLQNGIYDCYWWYSWNFIGYLYFHVFSRLR